MAILFKGWLSITAISVGAASSLFAQDKDRLETIIEECGHIANMEQPETFNRILDDFFANRGA